MSQDVIIIAILQMKKVKLSEIKTLVQIQLAKKWQSLGLGDVVQVSSNFSTTKKMGKPMFFVHQNKFTISLKIF
jgi:hypothetical protein